jgi:hypothetical protein
MNGDIEFEIGREPDSYRAVATVDHTWGLSLFKKVPLFVNPADRLRVKPAGFLQMWLSSAGMSVFVLLLLMAAGAAARFGAGQTAESPTDSRWMFSRAAGPLSGGITLHSPPGQWKIVLVWSLLGVAMAIIPLLGKGGNPVSRVGYILLGTAFATALWGFAWHTKSMEISANESGIRMTSVLGWRELPWGLIRSVEDQDIFTTYYNGTLRMWELPFPGSSIRVLAFNGERDRTLMSFSPDLQPQDSLKRLFDLCARQTGLKLHGRAIAIHY